MEEKARRDAFNMKVLKRQDPLIVNIVGSAAFVVLYELDGEWTKLGIEGPMFLYRRSSTPKYGFSVLNRNGIENYTANITGDDDLELTEDFLIYRAQSEEQVLGIWIYDAQERASIGQTMSQLHKDTFSNPAESSQPAPQAQALGGQSISLDALFGTPAPPAAQVEQPRTTTLSGTDLLDSMFKSAAATSVPPQSAYSNGAFGQSVPSSSSTTNGADLSAADLKALLGLTSAPTHTPANDSSNAQPLPQGLETLFASARVSDERRPLTATKNNATFEDLASESLNEALRRQHTITTTALGRRDFVRELLSLIHTDKSFVDKLYENYLSRVQ